MKKIIGNKLYNTETAKLLGVDGGGDGFAAWHEELFQKRTGEFFLYGKGGPMTRYAVSVSGNAWSGGEKIIPVSAEQAREWAEEHLDAEAYAEIFGIPDEGEDVAALNIQIDAALMARLRGAAAEGGMSLRACVEKLLRAGLEKCP